MIPVERLQTIPLFSELDVENLGHLASLFHRTSYKRGDVICRQGDEGDAFFVIESGTLRVRHVDSRGRERILGYMPPPPFFGETSLLMGLSRDATVEVFSEEALLWVLFKQEFDQVLNRQPGLKDQLKVRPEVQQKLATRVYSWLSPGEIVAVSTRRHWYSLWLMLRFPLIVALILGILMGVAFFFNASTKGAFEFATLVGNVLLGLLVLWLVGSIVWTVVDWSNDFYIVTNKRVVHIEKVVGFFEEREQAPIEQVTNVQETSLGLASRVLGFGDVRVETLGHGTVIDFAYSPKKARIRERIFEQLDRLQSRAAFEQRERRRAAMREELQDRLAPPLPTPSGVTEAASVGNIPSPALFQPATRQRDTSTLGQKLIYWFGLRIEEGNTITWRKHWVILLARIAGPLLAFLMLLSAGLLQISGVIPLTLIDPQSAFYWGAIAALFSLWVLGLIAAGGWLAYNYIDWRNDIYRVTEDRLMDLERSPFGLKESSIETTLDRVQDVSYVKPNIIANLFNYGDLTIETGGIQGRLTFYSVFDPRGAAQEIFRRRDVYREQRQLQEIKERREVFLDWLEEYDRFKSGREHSKSVSGDSLEDGSQTLGDSSTPTS